MTFTYDKVKELFGTKDKDPNELRLQLSIKYPALKANDIFQIYKLTFDNYLEKTDEIEDSIAWHNRIFGGKTMLQIHKMNVDPKENCHSTYIFRNFHRVINETDEWDKQLKQKTLLNKFIKLKESIFNKNRKDYRNQKLLDLFEITCEFIDLIRGKNAV